MHIYLHLFYVHWQKSVKQWLRNIKLDQYEELFKLEGYSTEEDLENLKGLTRTDLQSIGITRRGKLIPQ